MGPQTGRRNGYRDKAPMYEAGQTKKVIGAFVIGGLTALVLNKVFKNV